MLLGRDFRRNYSMVCWPCNAERAGYERFGGLRRGGGIRQKWPLAAVYVSWSACWFLPYFLDLCVVFCVLSALCQFVFSVVICAFVAT